MYKGAPASEKRKVSMAKSRSELKVGIVVFLAIAVFIAGIVWLKGYRFRQQFEPIKLTFKDIGALSEGDPVAVSGVRAGKVDKIRLEGGRVVVTTLVDESVFLAKDATFTVKNIGLMGERFVAVDPGTLSVPLDTDKIHEGRFDTGIPEVMGMMGEMISEVRRLVNVIGETIASPGTLNDFQETIKQLKSVATELNTLVAQSKDDYRKSLQAIERASASFDDFVESNRPKAEESIENFNAASEKLVILANDLDTLSSSLQQFADKLNSEEGTLGLLASDQTLYQDVKKSVRELDRLVTDIRENPKKYLKMEFSIF